MHAIVIQSLTCISANLAGFVSGTIMGWGTAAIPMLEDPDSPNPLSSDEIGWVTSTVGLGAMIGAITTWWTLDKIGRKSTLMLSMVPMIASYVIMSVQKDYPLVLLGRGLAGCGVGIFMSAGPLYIGEIAENRVRGAMGVFGVISTNLGSLFVYIVGPYLTISELNTLCGTIAAALMICLIFIPESPYYHLIQGDTNKAQSTLMWLRRMPNIKTELHTMKFYVDQKKMEKSSAFDLVTKSRNRRAIIILVILQTMQTFSGSLAIPIYAYGIFHHSGYQMSLHKLVVMMGVVTLIASFVGVFLVDYFGRRPVLFFSTSIMSFCLMVLGTFYTLQYYNYNISHVSWTPSVAVMGYVASHSVGLHSLPAILLSEYFSTDIKAKAAMIFTIFHSVGDSASLKLFQLSYDALSFGPTFLICCAFLLVSTLILFFLMPETKGCSLQTIETIHSGQTISNSSPKVDGNLKI